MSSEGEGDRSAMQKGGLEHGCGALRLGSFLLLLQEIVFRLALNVDIFMLISV